MGGEWKSQPLSSLLAEGRGISYGIVQPGAHLADGVPIVRVADIRGGRIATDRPLKVASEIEATYARTRLNGGELLLTLVGTVGEAAVVPTEMKGWNVARAVAVVPVRECVGAYWVKLALNAPEAREMIYGRLNTTVQATLNLKDVAQLPILLPDKGERKRIAHILGTLDDKIELNRRMNETLEGIARTIFQSWFVDFEPVRAKVSGEPPESICRRLGLTPELLALFPDRLVDSELGEIPEGWTYSTLAAEAKRCGGVIQTGPFGSQLHAADYVPEGVPVVMPQDISNRRVSVARVARVTAETASRLARHVLEPGDVVYSRRGDVERHALISDREHGWLCGTGCLLVRLGESWPSQAYLSEALDLPTTRRWLVQHAVGATMPNLNTAILGAVPLLLPSDILLRSFELYVGVLRRWSVSSSAQSDNLARIRDLLLPRLLSGELRVPLEAVACR